LGKQQSIAKTKYQRTKNKSLAIEQKIAVHHLCIRTANITIILNISTDLYFKKKFGVPKVCSD
jgi:hypothetical protein